MAPEIKEGKFYNGLKSDTFSLGVILFILVKGIYPFKEAVVTEPYYKYIYSSSYDQYW